MAKVKTTLSLDERLMRVVRVRAARLGRTQSDVLEVALREGLSAVERMRSKASLEEQEALRVASDVVHEVRRSGKRGNKRG